MCDGCPCLADEVGCEKGAELIGVDHRQCDERLEVSFEDCLVAQVRISPNPCVENVPFSDPPWRGRDP